MSRAHSFVVLLQFLLALSLSAAMVAGCTNGVDATKARKNAAGEQVAAPGESSKTDHAHARNTIEQAGKTGQGARLANGANAANAATECTGPSCSQNLVARARTPLVKPSHFDAFNADISLAASGPATVIAGTPITYLATVTNAGPDPATGISVTLPLPAGTSYSTVAGTDWACSSDGVTVTCTGDDIPATTASSQLSIQLAVASSASGTLMATLTAYTTSTDPNNADNNITVHTTVTRTSDLSVSASGPASVATGGAMTYSMTLNNVGPSDVPATITVTLPVGMAYTGFTGTGFTCGVVGQVVTCPGPSLVANGGGESFSLMTTAPLAGGLVTSTFVVSSVATDPNGGDNTSPVPTTVIAPLTLSPPTANVIPGATKTFTAAGGFGGYTYSMQAAPSGGSVDPASGLYTAGSTGSMLDIVLVTDGLGSTATANVNVGPGASILPASKSLAPRGTQTFTASGGNGSFTYSVSTNNSGATINSANGAYVAGVTGSVTDIVQAIDTLGNFAQATVTVGAGVAISPPSPPVTPPKGSVTFSAVGGSGSGYTWSVTTTTGATINASGIYKAGVTGNTTDTVKVTDSLGNTSTVVVTVSGPLVITPAAPSTSPPKGSIAFSVSGGSGLGYSWTLTTNGSGTASINGGSGLYVAGATGGKTDAIQVVDSLGNVATRSITVSAGVAIVPATKTTPPRGPISFSASGGSNTGFAYAFIANGSGASLDPVSGAYVAGPTGSKTDTVSVTDSLGNTATATITVSAGVTITPPNPSVAPKGAVAFTANGGSATGFSWSVSPNNSGATINAGTGAYVAGTTGSVSDVVTVTDSLGNSTSVNVSVGGGLTINPVSPSTPPKGSVSFKVTGGSGMGFVWAVSVPNSGGTIVPATGVYTAGATGNVVDTVTVTDSLGNVSTMTVTVGAGITITPGSAGIAPLGAQSFAASGGSGAGYVWSLAPGPSGGTIGATGAYKAGTVGSVTDVVKVVDSLGNVQTANVTVSAAVAVNPKTITVAPRGSQNFTASGGIGPYSFVLQTNGSGGNVNATGGAYTAGPMGSVTDIVKVTDGNGATANATVTVGPIISISPALPAAPPLGAIALIATGGGGTPYAWSIIANNSGSMIDASTGAYVAGTKPNVTDTVQVADALGNMTAVNISVGSGLTVNPVKATAPPRGTLDFFVRGGSGTGYIWSLDANASGATIDASTGKYVAGATGSVTDIVRVTDAVGAHESVTVAVSAGVTVTPTKGTVPAGGHLAFNVAGGSGTRYAWSVASNQSGASVNTSTGEYTAGSKGNVTDIVSVQDSLGNGASATVAVTAVATMTTPDAGPPETIPDGGIDADIGTVVVPPESGCGCSTIGSGGASNDHDSSKNAAGFGFALSLAIAFARYRRSKGKAEKLDR